MVVRVLGDDAPIRGAPDRGRALGREIVHDLRDFVSVVRDEHLVIGIEELFDAFPGVGDDARRRARGFEDARRRGESVTGHALARDVEHRARRAVERVVSAGEDVADVLHVTWLRLVVPSGAAEEEAAMRRGRGGAEKIFVDAQLAIGKTIAEERNVGVEARIAVDGKVRRAGERVVDRYATPRAELRVRV